MKPTHSAGTPRTPVLKILALSVLGAAALSTSTARSEASTGPCPQGEKNALSRIACGLREQLGASTSGASVVSAPPVSDRPLRNASGLAARLSSVVAGRLANASEPAGRPMSLGEAQSFASKRGRLVYLVPIIEHGELRVTADAYPVARSFWDRVRNPRAAPSGHGFASVRIDAEVASFFEVVPLMSERIERAKQTGDRAMALACGDVAADGSLELVVVGRNRLLSGNVRRGQFVARSQARWTDLAHVAPSPLKQPIAAAAVTADGRIVAGTTDRATALLLSARLDDAEALQGVVPWGMVACLGRSGTALGEIDPCRPGDAPNHWVQPISDLDAVASGRIVDPVGRIAHAVAWRRQSDSTVVLVDDRQRRVEIASVGAQIALGDVDLDGQIELVSSANTLDPKADALVVRTWLANGTIRERYRLAVPTGIHALAICPPEAYPRAAIVAATHDELWIVR